MTIQYKIFHIPVYGSQESEDELNRFFRSVKVLQTDRKFVEQGTGTNSLRYATGYLPGIFEAP